jgi:hypothetical protein
MRAVVVHESFFGTTGRLAAAVAEGIRAAVPDAVVTVHDVRTAPPAPEDADLLVVGGPTHVLGLSSRASRWLHAQYWGDPVAPLRPRRPHGRPSTHASLRGWLDDLPTLRRGTAVAAFDTRTAGPLAGGAAGGIARRLGARGADLVAPPEGFVVDGVAGPLRRGEEERAAAWAATVARAAAARRRPGNP